MPANAFSWPVTVIPTIKARADIKAIADPDLREEIRRILADCLHSHPTPKHHDHAAVEPLGGLSLEEWTQLLKLDQWLVIPVFHPNFWEFEMYCTFEPEEDDPRPENATIIYRALTPEELVVLHSRAPARFRVARIVPDSDLVRDL